MRGTTIGGLFLVIIGIIMVVRGFTAKYLYIDTEGTIPQEEMRPATIAKRICAISVGLVAIGLGIYNIVT